MDKSPESLDYSQKPPLPQFLGEAGMWALAAINIGLAIVVIWQVYSRYPENHSAADLRWLWGWCVASAIIAALTAASHRRIAPTIANLVSIALLAAVIWFIHRFGLMLSYEEWIKMGMPRPWEIP